MNPRVFLPAILCGTAMLILISPGPAIAGPATPKKGQTSGLSDLKLVEGDEQGNEMKSLKAELLVSSAEAKAIEQGRRLLAKYRGTPMEPELRFRLAELYMRKAKTDRFFEVHRESETVVRFAPRVARAASSRGSVQSAIAEYGTIQKAFPGFGQMDLVIFNHAFALQVLDDDKAAERLYAILIAKFGDSMLVPDAYLAIGEIDFNRNQFSKALESFNAIVQYPQSRVYPYGLYKAAWTYYNMRDAVKGLKKLEEVVAFGKMVMEKGIDARLDLRKEALNDMTLFFEDVFPSSEANRYFTAQAGKAEVGPILLKMGTLYERHSRYNDQRVVLDQFIKDLPQSPLLPQVHTDLVNAYDHLRQKDVAVERLERFNQLCAGSWAKSNPGVDCRGVLNETALKVARKWMGAWKKLPADMSYAEASEKAFEIYLRTAGESEDVAQSRYAYAELLFARKKYRQASREYALVSQNPKAGQTAHDASYAAVLSLEKAVGGDNKWSADDEQTFHKLAAFYVQKNPKGQYRLDVEYKMALLAYEKERYDEAAPIFLRLGREFAGQEKGVKAQDLYLDILNIKKDYGAIRTYAENLMKGRAAPEREQRLRKLYEQAYFLEVQGLEEKAKYKEALAEYQAFARLNPKSDLTEKAVWNSMQLQFRLGDQFNGSKTAMDFATRYPNSSQAVNALLRAAQSFESMGRLSDAAAVLEKLAVMDGKSKHRWRELAADFYAMDRRTEQSRKIYADLKAQGDAANKVRLLNKLDAFEKAYGSPAQQAAVAKQMVEMNIQPQAGMVKVHAVEKLFGDGKYTEAFNEARHWLGSSALTPNQKAHMRLIQARVLEDEFVKQSVKSRAEKVAAVLAIKTEKLQKTQEALQSAIKYGDPEVSMEAFERLYGCFAHYVKALKEMPTPAGLSDEDNKAFRDEIGNLLIPLEEKSVDTLAQALQFARKHSTFDNRADRLQAELDKLNHQTMTSLNQPLMEPRMMLPLVAGVAP